MFKNQEKKLLESLVHSLWWLLSTGGDYISVGFNTKYNQMCWYDTNIRSSELMNLVHRTTNLEKII